VIRLAPFMAVAVALAGVNVWFQTHGTGTTIRQVSWVDRLLGAGAAVWFLSLQGDPARSISPSCIPMENRRHLLSWWIPLAAAIVVTACLWRYRNTWSRPRSWLGDSSWSALIPVMGFTDVGYMRYSLVADRYQHIAIIAIVTSAAAGWGILRTRLGRAADLVATLVVAWLALLAWTRTNLYAEPRLLFGRYDPSESRFIDRLRQSRSRLDQSRRSRRRVEAAAPRGRTGFLGTPTCNTTWAVELLHDAKNQEAAEHYQLAIQLGRRGGAPYADWAPRCSRSAGTTKPSPLYGAPWNFPPPILGPREPGRRMRQNESPVRSHP